MQLGTALGSVVASLCTPVCAARYLKEPWFIEGWVTTHHVNEYALNGQEIVLSQAKTTCFFKRSEFC